MVIEPFDMLLPQHLPAEDAVADWMVQHRNTEWAGHSLAGRAATRCLVNTDQEFAAPQRSALPGELCKSDQAITNRSMAKTICSSLSDFPGAGKPLANPEGQPDDLAHDAYFHIQRVEGDEVAVFVRMAIAARLIFLNEVDESPVSISQEHLSLIDRSLADLIACLLGGSVNSSPHVTSFECRGHEIKVMPRWIRGHQIFAALTQGLIFSFHAMAHALRSGNGQEMRRWADLTISLFRGSGSAFELTGDYSAEDYTILVRPSMMPPACPIGLSGLMSFDHRFLIQTIRDMRPGLKACASRKQATMMASPQP